MKVITLLEIGDTVFLNSGSQEMTVTALSEDGKQANVRWINDEGFLCRDAFPVAALVPKQLLGREIKFKRVK